MAAIKTKKRAKRAKGNADPQFIDCETMTGPEFLRIQHRATDYYRTEYKASDLYSAYFSWLKDNGYTKQQISHIRKFGQELGTVSIYAKCILSGMPDYHAEAAQHWESLPGTSGTVRPTSEFLHQKAEQLLARISDNIEEEEEASTKKVDKPTIQDHLREKSYTTMGDLEDLYDQFIANDSKPIKEKPFNIIHASNLPPQFINIIIAKWGEQRDELIELQTGTCEQLNEGFAHWNKIQVRNNIKFIEQIIADCNSYLQLKKTNKNPRKRKPVSPEKLTRSFKHLKADESLGIKSVKVTDLAGAGEAYFYDVKKRKLISVVADSYAKTFSVKGASLVGIDAGKTMQKTLRKPAEQLKEFMKLSVPKRRKWFSDLKAVEIKYTGRSNENLLLLAIR